MKSKADIAASLLVWLKGGTNKEELQVLTYRHPFTFAEVVAVWSACECDIGVTKSALEYAVSCGGSPLVAMLEAMRRSNADLRKMAEYSLSAFGTIGTDTTIQAEAHYVLCQVSQLTGMPVRDALVLAHGESARSGVPVFYILLDKRDSLLEDARNRTAAPPELPPIIK